MTLDWRAKFSRRVCDDDGAIDRRRCVAAKSSIVMSYEQNRYGICKLFQFDC